MIEIYVGLPGSGKSLRTAEIVMELLERNVKYYKKLRKIWERQWKKAFKREDTDILVYLKENKPKRRKVCSNIGLSKEIESDFRGFINYWSEPRELTKLRDCDVIWDEVATHLDSTQWQVVPLELKRWLQQHRKLGIDIYGNTQDFPMIDISMRRLVSRVFMMKKIIGSRDKSATRPPVDSPWGVVIMREIDTDYITQDKTEYKFISSTFMFIKKKLCEAFDTTQEIKAGSYPPLRHIDRVCEKETCGFHKEIHV